MKQMIQTYFKNIMEQTNGQKVEIDSGMFFIALAIVYLADTLAENKQ